MHVKGSLETVCLRKKIKGVIAGDIFKYRKYFHIDSEMLQVMSKVRRLIQLMVVIFTSDETQRGQRYCARRFLSLHMSEHKSPRTKQVQKIPTPFHVTNVRLMDGNIVELRTQKFTTPLYMSCNKRAQQPGSASVITLSTIVYLVYDFSHFSSNTRAIENHFEIGSTENRCLQGVPGSVQIIYL